MGTFILFIFIQSHGGNVSQALLFNSYAACMKGREQILEALGNVNAKTSCVRQ